MQDVAFFEAHGLPAVALLSSGFKKQAAFEASRVGCPSLATIFVPHPISNCAPGEVAAKADAAFEALLAALEHGPAAAVPAAAPVAGGNAGGSEAAADGAVERAC